MHIRLMNSRNLFKIISFFALILQLDFTSAQVNNTGTVNADTSELAQGYSASHVPELEYIGSDFHRYKSFMFRRVAQEYIANENGFLLDVELDTAFLIFTRSAEDTSIFTGNYFDDDEGEKPFKKRNDIEKLPLEIKLAPNGKISELVNWKIFRDYFVSSLSKQAQAELITPAFFREQKEVLNKEAVVRLIVMEDLHYLFDLYGDTVDLNLTYLRVKGLKSPFSGKKLQVLGNLSVERLEGAANTLRFKAQNKADGPVKQQLMDEAIRYLKAKEQDKYSSSQILNVGLNSEQEFDYNLKAKCLMKATLSDVVVLNLQSRGNVRVYQLWDYRFPWE